MRLVLGFWLFLGTILAGFSAVPGHVAGPTLTAHLMDGGSPLPPPKP
ncbi:MAG TPA: hypothetical protein VN083_09570 [Vicinamibacteria bacterium]|jgi:hypothetical protein|nr:hypothetical protein [Vicinamibacteria bacterium]